MAQYDVIIVGAGPAGMTAAIYAARADMNVLLLDKLAPGGQIINTNEIQNYPGVGTINGAELAYQMFEHTQQFENIAFDYGTVKEIWGNRIPQRRSRRSCTEGKEQIVLERLTIPDEKIEGGWKRAIIDAREVRKYAMTIYWALKKYEDTGLTAEEVAELIEKDTAKEPIKNDLYYFCPNCKTRRSIRQKHDFCHDCGQRLKWED